MAPGSNMVVTKKGLSVNRIKPNSGGSDIDELAKEFKTVNKDRLNTIFLNDPNLK